ncbi:MAG: DUF4367 domain-containing protein [Lachnospiraceae bacterium]|nr:DUF4367 domain-containing protein [Lachnospiraceae bacterium]
MRLEDMRYDFPKMPKEMRDMIEREVEKQVKMEQPQFRKNRRRTGRIAAASLAAVMLCGTTVFAGVNIYRMQQEKTGAYGVKVDISGSVKDAERSTDFVVETQKTILIPNVKLEVGYLPEGMVKTENGKYSFENALNKGGVSMAFFRMDTGDDKFEIEHGNVAASEDFSANGHDAVYLQYPDLYEEEITFNQRIYVAYTDVHYVMEMYVASDVSKEEAFKIAESVKLTPTENLKDEDLVVAQDWSQYHEYAVEAEDVDKQAQPTVSKEEMKNTHAIGDSFSLGEGLSAKVSKVQVADDISLLDASLLDEDFTKEVDENGKLRPATIQYVKDGGMDELSQEIKSREAAQKLVYATIEYTNTTEKEMTDVLFSADLPRINEVDGQMQIVEEEKPGEGDEWESAINHGLSSFWEMSYYDVHGGERGNNYIASIKPGETVTVHVAWIVLEEELNKLYLNLNPSGGCYEFSDSSLETGFVDIRQ